jgi:hypothetical protein
MRSRTLLVAAGLAAGLLHGADVRAQDLWQQCAAVAGEAHRALCRDAADAALIIQPRLGIAATGGNPVPGTASTLGMRIRSTPRIAIGVRTTASRAAVPGLEQVGTATDAGFVIASASLDAAVGVYPGLMLLPTVGGFGSIDLLGSVGVLPIPGGASFPAAAPVSWSVGARLGILRESFTAPGVSLSAAYRSTGELAWGSATLADRDAAVRLRSNQVTAIRAVVGKRVGGVGLLGGAGYDFFGSDATLFVRAADGGIAQFRDSDMDGRRATIFGNASLTLLILNVSAEAGWQQGGPALEGATRRRQQGGLFGGVAARLAI